MLLTKQILFLTIIFRFPGNLTYKIIFRILMLFICKVDLIHINSEPDNDTVSYGMDLSEYYLNVEWDILSVPAERHVKTYPCCPEPYPGKL